MRSNTALSLLRSQQVALGTWLQLHSYQASRMLAAQGMFHWLLVDYEHTPVDRSTAAAILSAIADVSGGRVTPLARVASGSIQEIKHALDAGAQGIIVPMIRDAREVKEAVEHARFPPEGSRGAGGLSPHLGFGVSRPVYIQIVNREILVGVQIETREALENLDEILDVPGVDLCFIGPNDLHLALGYPPVFWSQEPRFQRAIERIKEACGKRGIPLGTLCRDVTQARARVAEGFTFVGLGSDAHFVLQYAGIQYGELHGKPEPPETWCNAMKFFDGPGAGGLSSRTQALAAPAIEERAAPPPPMPSPLAPPPECPASVHAPAPALARPSRLATFEYDPDDPAFDLDPFPAYRYMRENCPVFWWPQGQGFVVTRYDDVMTLLHDKRFSVEIKHWEHGPPEVPDDQLTTHQVLARYGIFWLPDVDHRRVRRVLGPLFSPKSVDYLRASFQAVVDEMLAPVVGKPAFDLVSDFTARYPLHAITHILGIPRDQQAKFIQFGSAVIDAFYPAISPEALAEKMAFLPTGVAMLEDIMAERRKRPGADFLSKLIHAEEQGDRLTKKEVMSIVALMISAGCEPPRHLVTFAMFDLMRHPAQLALLRREPALLRNAVDEAGRFDSFGKLNLPRFPLEDLELRGVPIRKGQQVFGVFASALRDPSAFPDPDTFDIRREQRQSLLYGDGPHVCMGAAIARLMCEAAVGTLVTRYPNMRLAGSPVFTRNTFFRKIVSLPVQVG